MNVFGSGIDQHVCQCLLSDQLKLREEIISFKSTVVDSWRLKARIILEIYNFLEPAMLSWQGRALPVTRKGESLKFRALPPLFNVLETISF